VSIERDATMSTQKRTMPPTNANALRTWRARIQSSKLTLRS